MIASLFLIPNATFFVELAVVLVLIYLFYKYLLPPLNKAMESRQEQIRSSLEAADRARQDAEAADDERHHVLEEARGHAREIVAMAQQTADQLRADATSGPRRSTTGSSRRPRPRSQVARQRAVDEAAARLGEVVIEVVTKVVGREINAESHRDLIDEAIAALDRGVAQRRRTVPVNPSLMGYAAAVLGGAGRCGTPTGRRRARRPRGGGDGGPGPARRAHRHVDRAAARAAPSSPTCSTAKCQRPPCGSRRTPRTRRPPRTSPPPSPRPRSARAPSPTTGRSRSHRSRCSRHVAASAGTPRRSSRTSQWRRSTAWKTSCSTGRVPSSRAPRCATRSPTATCRPPTARGSSRTCSAGGPTPSRCALATYAVAGRPPPRPPGHARLARRRRRRRARVARRARAHGARDRRRHARAPRRHASHARRAARRARGRPPAPTFWAACSSRSATCASTPPPAGGSTRSASTSPRTPVRPTFGTTDCNPRSELMAELTITAAEITEALKRHVDGVHARRRRRAGRPGHRGRRRHRAGLGAARAPRSTSCSSSRTARSASR